MLPPELILRLEVCGRDAAPERRLQQVIEARLRWQQRPAQPRRTVPSLVRLRQMLHKMRAVLTLGRVVAAELAGNERSL